MSEEPRPKSECVKEIKSYNGLSVTKERLEDLDLLMSELGGGYDVRVWSFGKHLRTAVIKDGVQL